MNISRYFFSPQNLKIDEKKCLAIAEKKKEELQLLCKKIYTRLCKDEEFIKELTQNNLITPEYLKILEQSKKKRSEGYQLVLQLQNKILSNHTLNAPPFSNVSGTTQFLTPIEINNLLDAITILTLSIEISETLLGVFGEKDFSHAQDNLSEKIDHFNTQVKFSPNNSDDFLNKINTDLMHLATTCVSLGACFFMYAAISHFTLVAAAVFLCTGLSFYGISIYIQFINQKTETFSVLIELIDYFKSQDLKFDYDSIYRKIQQSPDFYESDSSSEGIGFKVKLPESLHRGAFPSSSEDDTSSSFEDRENSERSSDEYTEFDFTLMSQNLSDSRDFDYAEKGEEDDDNAIQLNIGEIYPDRINDCLYAVLKSSENPSINSNASKDKTQNTMSTSKPLETLGPGLNDSQNARSPIVEGDQKDASYEWVPKQKPTNEWLTIDRVKIPHDTKSTTSYNDEIAKDTPDNSDDEEIAENTPNNSDDNEDYDKTRRHCFFTNETKSPSFSHQQIGRLAFYPTCVLMGHATLGLVGQSMILAAAPPLMHLIILATISALLLMPIFASIKFLIDKNLSESSFERKASYVLLYFVDLLVNLKLIAFLAVMLYRPIMNIFALYTIVGAGIFPVVTLSILAALAIQSYRSSQNNRSYPEQSSTEYSINDRSDNPTVAQRV